VSQGDVRRVGVLADHLDLDGFGLVVGNDLQDEGGVAQTEVVAQIDELAGSDSFQVGRHVQVQGRIASATRSPAIAVLDGNFTRIGAFDFNALDGFGPFSPERAGTLPAGQLIDLCHSGRYTTEELKKRISGKAGLAAHLGTTDIPAIERRIAEGDTHAALVLDAMIYRIAKEIGGAAVVLYGKVDAILLTGGMAHSEYITSRLQERVSFLAPVHVYPGEDELEALVMNALGALRGELPVQVYR